MYDTNLIKSRMSCVEYAQRYGLPIRKDGDRCKSPLRTKADNKSAFSVRKDYWHDFVSGDGGDVIDLCAMLAHGGDRGLAIAELARLTGVTSEDDNIDWKQITQRRCSDIAGWHASLRTQDYEYLCKRGINEETIKCLRIGYTGMGVDVVIKGEKVYGFAANRIAIPYYKNGYVVSWVARATSDVQKPKYLKPPCDDLTEHEPWGLHTLDRESNTLYIAEGAFDALSLDQSGVPVLATMGGYFGKEALRNVISICKDYKTIVLTFDNDEAGRKFTFDLGNTLFRNKIHFVVANIPVPYKDISDYYAAGNKISDLALSDGIAHISTAITDKEQFKDFAYKAARIMDKAELAEMFQKVSKTECFSSVWLKEIQSSCFKAPPEPIIVEEILKDHKLLYVAGVGFYEYLPQGKWERLNEEVVHGYISDSLGTFTSGNKLDPIKKLMKPEILTDHKFDRKPVINFINGTLDLETGEFRGHSQDDYCSIQLQYPYDPEAKCPNWESFLEKVTAQDAKRQENLQFIAGYVLFSDCRHEKIFVLTGEGGNGKTVYTKVLNKLFGDSNVTHITPKGLTEAFERIHLHNSILNIAGEIKSDISGAEETLKQIASGEPVQACYKGKDHVTFTSRSKLIFCCNGQLKSSDTSEGLTRRLVIVDFPCKFVEDPDPGDPYQFEKDIGLYDKLIEELPGIFNWAYHGYKDLLYYGSFTETNEHHELMDAFTKASNPIRCFVEDLLDDPPKCISKPEMYSLYQSWCDTNGHAHPMASNRFHQEFKRAAKKEYEPYEKSIRVNGSIRKERGYSKINKEV